MLPPDTALPLLRAHSVNSKGARRLIAVDSGSKPLPENALSRIVRSRRKYGRWPSLPASLWRCQRIRSVHPETVQQQRTSCGAAPRQQFPPSATLAGEIRCDNNGRMAVNISIAFSNYALKAKLEAKTGPRDRRRCEITRIKSRDHRR